jgi:hypothetical protein
MATRDNIQVSIILRAYAPSTKASSNHGDKRANIIEEIFLSLLAAGLLGCQKIRSNELSIDNRAITIYENSFNLYVVLFFTDSITSQ